MTRLPIVDGGAACFGCDAPCCTSYVVPIQGFDLWRLVRGLQLPWDEVAEARPADWDGFAVDGSESRLGLWLRPREAEVCRFLLTLPGGQQRCGAHSARPLACRVYPYTPSDNNQLGVELMRRALCPPSHREHFAAQLPAVPEAIAGELAERPLYQLAIARWNDGVAAAGRRFVAAHFAAWVLRLYDAIWPLRSSDEWRPEAARLISEFPTL
jgi:Fe-S-cluster containining protein